MKSYATTRLSLRSTFLGVVLLALCTTAPTTRPAAASNPTTISPEALAQIQQWDQDNHDAQVGLKAKDYATAEADFKKVIAFQPDGEAYFGLALIYTAQGRTAKALQMYQEVFHPSSGTMTGGTFLTQAHLEYALLLNQTGKWSEAVASYEAALPTLPGGDEMPKIDNHFDSSTPQPAALEAAIHLGMGIDASFHCNALNEYQQDRAFSEYTKALQLAPNWPVANYYYGYGWGDLPIKNRAKAMNVQQARAAFAKAVKLGKGPVKAAAQKALRVAMKPQ